MAQRAAIIGLGGIAQKGYLPLLSNWKDLKICFHSRTPEKLEAIAGQYHIAKATTNFSEVMDWHPQCAFILTPTPTHAELAVKLLKAGVDVYMEKPATPSSAETRELAKLADAQKRILMIAFNRRYAPLSQKAREIWGNRKVALGNFQKSRMKPFFKRLITHINEELVHVIDLIRFLCGEAKALQTVCNLGPHELVMEVASLLQLESGGYASMTATLQAGHWYEHYELNGESATLKLNCFYDLQMIMNEQIQTWKEPYDSTWSSNLVGRGFYGQIEHFFKCVQNREQPNTNAWDSVKTQLLVEDIIAKAQYT